MKRLLPRAVSLILLAMLVAACSGEHRGKQWAAKKRAREAKQQGERGEHGEQGPSTPPGETLFAENCRKCHKVGAKGGAIGPDLSAIGRTRDGQYLEQVLRQPSQVFPGTVMPPFDNLSAEQINNLVDYLLSLK